MKLLAILRFELAYQLSRPWPWLSFAVLIVFAFFNTRIGIVPVTLPKDFVLNSPFIITSVSVFSSLIWLLIAPAIAGEAAARDVHTGIHPLTYTSPVSKAEYLGGRFIAAFLLNLFVLLGVQIGSLLAAYAPGVDPEIIGPFRPAAYVVAFAFIAMPNAFVATTIQFSSALLTGRSMASYFGSMLLLFFTVPVPVVVYFALGQPTLAKMMDPIGFIAIMNEMMSEWTIIEKNVRMFSLEGPMMVNRLVWIAIALLTLAATCMRFRFAHRTTAGVWNRIVDRLSAKKSVATPAPHIQSSVVIPKVRASFDFTTDLRQTIAIGASSFRMIAASLPGLFLLFAFPGFLAVVMTSEMEHWGVPLLPRTGYILPKHAMSPITQFADYRVIVPLLIIYFAGELVWRERDARLSENIDATSVKEWVLFSGKFVGLAGLLASVTAMMSIAGVITQLVMGYHEFQLGLSLQLLFGFQLPEYLVFALLALFLQAVVNQKHLGMVVSLVVYLLLIFASFLGVEHHMLVFGSAPGWAYTDMRGFGPSVAPWLWFKLYWAAWALLLGVVARLLWVRGRTAGFRDRLSIARSRLTRATLGAALTAAGLIVTLGGFIFYNTNIINEYRSSSQAVALQGEYERRYGKYEGIPQPRVSSASLRLEIYPDRGSALAVGQYRLVNRTTAAIESLHVETASRIHTTVKLDRPFKPVPVDERLGHAIYDLETPLGPGDSLTLDFNVLYEPRGFRNSGASGAVVSNGTHFTGALLPVIGYQPQRELMSATDRRKQGLPRKVTLPTPDDVDPNVAAGESVLFSAIVGTSADQVAVAPGNLKRTWTEGARRYFNYASDIPISGRFDFFSARYAVRREKWNDVDIDVFTHPAHTKNVPRLVRAARASLDYYTSEFGPYPYRFLQFVEHPGNGLGMGVDGSGVISGGEGVYLVDPEGNGIDVMTEIVAHEVAHQWWGVQLKHAFAEGAIVLSESLAWYSGMQVVKKTRGREGLRQFMSVLRQPNPWPPIRTGLPLLRAMDPYAGYRKGPFAMYALSEEIGEARVNAALSTLIRKSAGSLATTRDLYRELLAVTPDSSRSFLHDLFEVNAFWTFDTKKATAVQTKTGTWRVTFALEAKKVVADSAGVETERPIDELVQIGVFAAAEPGELLGKPIYVQRHRIRSGRQTVTVEVPQKPARGGIDPYNLLDWEEGDNIEAIDAAGPGDKSGL